MARTKTQKKAGPKSLRTARLQSDFDKVVDAVRALSAAEQWRLRDLLETWLCGGGPIPSEEQLRREMARRGLLEVPPPIQDLTPYRNRKLAKVEGKPVSETIIEERR